MKLKDILNNLNITDIVNIMSELGSAQPRSTLTNPIMFQTICHNGSGEGHFKLAYYHESKSFYCFTECGCSYSLLQLIAKVKGIEKEQAFGWLCEFLNITNIYTLQHGFAPVKLDHSFLNKFKKIQKIEEEFLKEHNQKVLNLFYNLYHKSWVEDHISVDTMKLFNIKFDISNNRIIIPHYDINNRMVGIKCRNLDKRLVDLKLKYVPIKIGKKQYNYQTSLNLYGLNINKQAIQKYKHVILFESEKAVMQHKTFYKEKSTAVAISGSAISLHQINLLLELGVEHIDIGLDKEFIELNSKEDRIYRTKIYNKFVLKLKTMFNISIIYDTLNLLEHKMSPTDLGKDIFEKLYNNKINI